MSPTETLYEVSFRRNVPSRFLRDVPHFVMAQRPEDENVKREVWNVAPPSHLSGLFTETELVPLLKWMTSGTGALPRHRIEVKAVSPAEQAECAGWLRRDMGERYERVRLDADPPPIPCVIVYEPAAGTPEAETLLFHKLTRLPQGKRLRLTLSVIGGQAK